MTHMNVIQQDTFVPFVMVDLTEVNNSQLTFCSLWGYLKTANYLGYRYYSTAGNSSIIQYGDGAKKFYQADCKASLYDELLHRFRDEGKMARQVVSIEGIAGAFAICPVFGPYNQNAVFILHSSEIQADEAQEDLRKIHMVLQNAHVVISEYESIQREKKLSLSRREEDVLILMAEGMSNRSIADRLNLSVHTVNGYVRRMMLKLNASDRVSACMIGLSIPKVANKVRRCSPC